MAEGPVTDPTIWIEPVLRFWFGELAPRQWWNAEAAVDDAVRARFGALRASLVSGPPSPLHLDARGHVAAVIVFDQFPRHLFRGSAEAFATDALARKVTFDAIDRRLDEALPDALRQFLYMPLAHSEDIEVQRLSLRMFGRLADPDQRDARRHHDTILRFGRFPYRNDALGRASTDAERAYLDRRPRDG